MLKLSQVEVNFNWRGTFNAFASARSSVYDRPFIMKEQWSVSEEKLVNLEEGTTLESEPTGLKVVRERRSTCEVLVQYVKLILYVEFALLIGWACYSLWQTYRIESMEVTVGELIGKPHREIVIGSKHDDKPTKIDQLPDIQIPSDLLPVFDNILHEDNPALERAVDDLRIAEEKLIIAGENARQKQTNDASKWYVKLATTATPDSEQEFISSRLESSAESDSFVTTEASVEDPQLLDQTSESTESNDLASHENDAAVQPPKRQNDVELTVSLGPLWSILNKEIYLLDKSKETEESSAVDSNEQNSEEISSDNVVSGSLDEDAKDSDETQEREFPVYAENSASSQKSEPKSESSEEVRGRHSHLEIAGEALQPFKWLFQDTDSSEKTTTEAKSVKSKEEDESVRNSNNYDYDGLFEDDYLDDYELWNDNESKESSTSMSSSGEEALRTNFQGSGLVKLQSLPESDTYKGKMTNEDIDESKNLNESGDLITSGTIESLEEQKPCADDIDNDELHMFLAPLYYQHQRFSSQENSPEDSSNVPRLIENDVSIGDYYDYDERDDSLTLEDKAISNKIYRLEKTDSYTPVWIENIGTTNDNSANSEDISSETRNVYWTPSSDEDNYNSLGQYPTAPISKEKTTDKSVEIQWPWFDRAEPIDDVGDTDWNAVTDLDLGDITATVTRIVIGFSTDGFGLHECTMYIVRGTLLPIVCSPIDTFTVVNEVDDKRTEEERYPCDFEEDKFGLRTCIMYSNKDSSHERNSEENTTPTTKVNRKLFDVDISGNMNQPLDADLWKHINNVFMQNKEQRSMESGQSDNKSGMFPGRQNVETIGMTINDDGIRIWKGLNVEDSKFNDQTDSIAQLLERDDDGIDNDDIIPTISEIGSIAKLSGVFIPVYDSENGWTQLYKNQNSMMGHTNDDFALYKASIADADKEWEYIKPEADDMVGVLRKRRATINVPYNLDEPRENPVMQLFYRNLYDAAVRGMQQVPKEQSINDVDFQTFADKMTFLAAHIDRLHKRYMHHNELNDDYVSMEFPVEDY